MSFFFLPGDCGAHYRPDMNGLWPKLMKVLQSVCYMEESGKHLHLVAAKIYASLCIVLLEIYAKAWYDITVEGTTP